MFKDIVGNEKNKELLKNIIESRNISHCYMFVGQFGIGKFLFAKEFAKALLCINKGEKPCDKCNACVKFENGNNPDFIIIDEGENTIKTEVIKNLVKGVFEKPIQSERKVYIINNSENMTKEAQNSLLKTLEEPPEYVTIILITKSENLLLTTIKSRCTKIKFNALKDEELQKVLKDKYEIYEPSNNLLKIADGSVQRALLLSGKENIYEEIEKNFTNLTNVNIIDLLKCKEKIFKDKEDIYEILDYINIIFYNLISENIDESQKYIECIKIVENTKDRLKKNSNYDMTIDNLLFNIWEEVNG